MSSRVHVLNGPNLNLLGVREPQLYGRHTLSDVERMCRETVARYDLELIFRQTNAEHQMVEWLHQARNDAGIIINPAGFSYHAVSILDALVVCKCPVVEVHITNIHRREEEWRSKSIMTAHATGLISGLGVHGYTLGLEFLARHITETETARS